MHVQMCISSIYIDTLGINNELLKSTAQRRWQTNGESPAALQGSILLATFMPSWGSGCSILLLCVRRDDVRSLTVVERIIQLQQILRGYLLQVQYSGASYGGKKKIRHGPCPEPYDQYQRWAGGMDSKFIFLKRDIRVPDLEKYFMLCPTLWRVEYPLTDQRKTKAFDLRIDTSF